MVSTLRVCVCMYVCEKQSLSHNISIYLARGVPFGLYYLKGRQIRQMIQALLGGIYLSSAHVWNT